MKKFIISCVIAAGVVGFALLWTPDILWSRPVSGSDDTFSSIYSTPDESDVVSGIPGSHNGVNENQQSVRIEDECESDDGLIIPWDYDGLPLPYYKCMHMCHYNNGEHDIYLGPFYEYCLEYWPDGINVIIVIDYGCDDCYGDTDPDCTPTLPDFGSLGFWQWIQIEGEWYAKQTFVLPPENPEGCMCLILSGWLSGMNECYLAVELASFTAIARGEDILIEFTTASETDNDYFEIMRGESEDGEFAMLTRLESQGESASDQHYEYLDTDVTRNRTYWYYLVDVDINGTRTEHSDMMVSASVNGGVSVPQEYTLTAYPNPFNPVTNLVFTLPEAGDVHLAVYNISGQLIRELTGNRYDAGVHTVSFEAADLPSGLYFARLETDVTTLSAKLLLVK